VDGISALYEIGCAAALGQVREHEDGRFDLVTTGTQRFRLASLDHSRPYLQGEVDLLPEDTGDEVVAGLAAKAVRRAFRDYLVVLATQGIGEVTIPELPEEPVPLSYLVAASMVVDLPDRQALLVQPDALRRLEAERALLSRETAMLRTFTSAPAPGLRYSPWSPN
jgi:Lon protease-like protein